MIKNILIVVLMIVLHQVSLGQAKTRKLSSIINHPSLNLQSPYVSFDGNAIVFISDNAEDKVPTPFYSWRTGVTDWREPVILPNTIHSKLNFLKGYALSADGKYLYYTTQKSPGVGRFDLWMCELKGNLWTNPVNFGAPINTTGNEACPSVSTDGNVLYFMRCEVMDMQKADKCKIFMVRKRANGQWEVPIELPASINTGNSQTPRIMADGETLIFSSNKMPGGRGGMDLYQTRFKNEQWTAPMPLDFINTPGDDQYISVTALGRYLLRDSPGAKKIELVEYLFPDAIRPRGMMKLEGKISDGNNTVVNTYISVTELTSKKRIFNARPGRDGSFALYIPEGAQYELSVDPEMDKLSFYSRKFDLTTGNIPQIEKVNIIVKPVAIGDEFPLDLVQFKPLGSELDAQSNTELLRAVRMIKGNPSLRFEVQVMLAGYLEDSVRSQPDLTEISIDSIRTEYDDIDSLGQLYKRDTVLVKTRFHNNRTEQQAKAVVDYFIRQGIDPSRLQYFMNFREEGILEKRRISVKVKAIN